MSCALFLIGAALTSAALQPGPAQSSSTDGIFTLENNFLAVSWVATNGNLLLRVFVNKLATQSWTQAGSELFRLGYDSTGSAGATSSVTLAASDCSLVSGPQLQASQPNRQSARAGDQLPGQELVASFLDPASGIKVDWRAVLRDGANYIHQFLTIYGTNSSDQIDMVELLDYATTATPAQVGVVTGSPVAAGQAFFGGESPFATSILTSNRVRFSVSTALPLGPNIAYDFSAVAGVFPVGQLRRSFVYYLERERAAPYRQLLHFNSWFDAGYSVSEAEMLTAISACELELHQRRGVALDSYAMDDGWDNPSMGFWAIDTNKFPHQFDLLESNVTAVGSHLGLWISPLGGYSPRYQQRVQAAIDEGIITSNLDLSIPTYYTWWTNQCATFIISNAMNYFKWDAAGNGVTPHFMALLRAADALRGWSTNVFINVTAGTWPSPFWLNHVDSIWRGGDDSGTAGVGDANERWITYRDGQTWQHVVRPAPLYPLTSLMLHGIQQVGTDLRHEARSFFGSGLNLQELYLTPSMLTSDSWSRIAEAAAWARTNASVLVDSHWVGGNPTNLEVYGWAAWTSEKGIVVLRNPSSQTNGISFDIGMAFELPADAATVYNLTPSYADQRSTVTRLQAGLPRFITLLPFEVLVFDALPDLTPQPPTIILQPLPPARYCGGTVNLQAVALGSLPMSFQWSLNGVPVVFATNATLVLDNLDYTSAGNYSVTVSNAVGATTSATVALAVLTPGAFAAAVLADHPVAWWRMDETNGPTILDAWDSHNGAVFGNVRFGVPGAFTNDPDAAIYFDGSSGTRIDVPYAPALNPASFSFECWARVTGGAGTYRSPLTSRDDLPTRGYICYAASNDRWEFLTGTGGDSWDTISGPPVVPGQWTHLVGTFDGTNKSFYVNGQVVGVAQPTLLPNTSKPLRIGAGATENDGAFFFSGGVDEVAIYDHALGTAQVQKHYQASFLPLTLSILRCGENVLLAWPGGTLEQTDDLTSPWTVLSGTNSPLLVPLNVSKRFFRVRLPVPPQPPAITTSSPLPSGTAGVFYNQTLQAMGGTTPYNWSVISNSLPSGLRLVATSGAITGMPTVATTGSFRVRVMDASSLYSEEDFNLTIMTPFQLWQMQHFGCTNCLQAAANADPDGDGLSNLEEFLAGTDPTNSGSAFRIIEIAPEDDDMFIAWTAVGGKRYVLQTTTGYSGSFSNNFIDLNPAIVVLGTGETEVAVLHLGGATNAPVRFYRVRLVP